ncbi:fumarylacetoacetate hydrolase family protein [Paramagnetospirillum magneticum]|uniref:2-keto-4-pentenoate hydratase/2-oxohepta-3-ene-1,7-dioic acid hydratase n=1 Tax=Paramagnetospirillum magneticum (strain ATCC 700264 / AMB-1) TaxID=342108 RepID=Q2W3E4_PARM1|nr:fumarylacetoacetate hydrolase family protein [Paramagnetospirillum magneticum]BAE51631.1 2-keto-4-pentenoate hydratase/2-oxohepta-3-ene-1,7-dioic acid hydratase [Paramagnetospirillum magneticum AMB-1]
MDEKRRQFLTLGAGVAAGALLTRAAGAAGPIPNSAAGALRLVTYSAGGVAPRVGVVKASGRVVDLGAAAKARGMALAFDPASMVSLIRAGDFALAQARQLMQEGPETGPLVSEVRLLAPIPEPSRNVYAVGWNYLEHFKEGEAMRLKSADLPEHPVFFTKAVGTVNGPYDPIPYDAAVSTSIDWECELAVIIGKGGKNIAEADAMKHVFGFCVINDTTARDVQQKKHGGQWFKGKSLDGHGPLGPWIVPASDIDHTRVHLITRVNGVVKQDASTEQMYFKVPRIIAELSAGLTLEPGDIIATGTPPGVGGARKPPEFLKPGDVMETEIVEIGLLRNVIGG